jgi:valyl-tRNA synthetase
MRADVERATVTAPAEQIARVREAAGDLAAAGRVADLVLVEGPAPLAVDVVLAPPA